MIKNPFFEKYIGEIEKLLPENAKAINEDIKEQMRLAAEKMIESLNLVSRDEFDAQCKVLAKTREKVEQLEVIVKAMENNNQSSD